VVLYVRQKLGRKRWALKHDQKGSGNSHREKKKTEGEKSINYLYMLQGQKEAWRPRLGGRSGTKENTGTREVWFLPLGEVIKG